MAEDQSSGQADEIKTVPYRGGSFEIRPLGIISPFVFIGLIAFWEFGSRTGFISGLVLPSPTEVFTAFRHAVCASVRFAATADHRLGLRQCARDNCRTCNRSFFCGAGRFVAIGFSHISNPENRPVTIVYYLVWHWRRIEGRNNPVILFGTFFPTVIATYGGVDNVDRNLIRMGQSFGLSWSSIVRKIIFPGALPAILSGCRISASIAIILLVAAEMIGAEFGIGAYILLAGSLFATDQLIAGVAVLSVLGLCFAWVIGRAEKYFLRWRA